MTQRVQQAVWGWWQPIEPRAETNKTTLKQAIYHLAQPVYLLDVHGEYVPTRHGYAVIGAEQPSETAVPLAGFAPACQLEQLGDPSFCADHGLKYPYVAGAMANGCTSQAIVEEMAHHGMLGVFGAAGLSVSAVEAVIDRISSNLGDLPYGFNLLHSPNEPAWEAAIVDLYLRRQIRLISASAYLGLTLPVVRYRVHGIHRNASGQIVTPNRILAKVSRLEVATRFFSPPPERFLRELVASADISAEQARLAEQIPVAQDLTAEADSGGHTDNRPALTLFPTIVALRDQLQAHYNYAQRLRVGAAGGIATPLSAAAAFAMGAAYIMTGSVNQACVESGTSEIVRQMLAETQQADITMAPAADMFEMGVKVQVLKRGTMFAMRAAKLYDIYRTYDRLEDLPSKIQEELEQKYFRYPIATVWQQTCDYFQTRDASQIERANRDPKYKMALVFRWYLGQASRWAIVGDASRKIDYQVWCGPSMGAFNEWVKGSWLADPHQRKVATVAFNLLYGAGVISRINLLRAQGVFLPPECAAPSPLPPEEIWQRVSHP